MIHHAARIILYGILSVTIAMGLGCGGKSGGGGDQDASLVDSGVDGEDYDAGNLDGSVGDGGAITQPSQSITSGGGSISSSNYRLKLFIAPARPVGIVASPNYRIQLGPARAGDSQ